MQEVLVPVAELEQRTTHLGPETHELRPVINTHRLSMVTVSQGITAVGKGISLLAGALCRPLLRRTYRSRYNPARPWVCLKFYLEV